MASDGETDRSDLPRFAPKEFLKGRRPERFSDSTEFERPAIERSLLEYHLEVLTSNSLETPFENFARELAQREVCPNLLPQTGPTGGGDSKVDSETYPVAQALAFTWYHGDQSAASERWAFAFSAKKDWRSKVRSDIKKLTETNRGYSKAFFVTNQFVRDKTRAEVEDALTTEFGLDVRIFDRNWILDRVFSNNHVDLAITHLNVGGLTEEVYRGPLDAFRMQELERVEEQLNRAAADNQLNGVHVELAIEALELARGLEENEEALEGRLDRIKRLADKYAGPQQLARALYTCAWTSYWWLEDSVGTSELYAELESTVSGSENPAELEYLGNLWHLLVAAHASGTIDVDLQIETRREHLLNELGRLASVEERPSAALQAESLSLLVQLVSSDGHASGGERILEQLSTVVDRCEGLLGFPFEALIGTIIEISSVLEHIPNFDTVFERLIDLRAERSGQIAAAKAYLARGARQLDAGNPINAIGPLGKALTRLYKEESRDDLVEALTLIGVAYFRADLPWAARAAFIHAAHFAGTHGDSTSDLAGRLLGTFERLRLVELNLGRLPHSLEWHESAMLAGQALIQSGLLTPQSLSEQTARSEAVLSAGLLGLDIDKLKQLQRLPDALDHLQLFNASSALRWALGSNHLEHDFIDFLGDEETPDSYFKLLVEHPVASSLGRPVTFGNEPEDSIESNLLGCSITVGFEQEPIPLMLAQTLLAAMEALLATGFKHRAIAIEPSLSIQISTAAKQRQFLEYTIGEDLGRPVVDLSVASTSSPQHITELPQMLLELLVDLLPKILHLYDPEAWMKAVFGDEESIARALSFANSSIPEADLLGEDRKQAIGDWVSAVATEYELTRIHGWLADSDSRPQTSGSGPGFESPEEDYSQISHGHLKTVSMIRTPLWDAAGWSMTAFVRVLDDESPPYLAIVFSDPDAAEKIFRGWLEDIGQTDSNEQIRISIIRRVDHRNPASYTVSIGSDPLAGDLNPGSLFLSVNRYHTMAPKTTENLDLFLEAFEQVGSYYVIPAFILPGQKEPTFGYGAAIQKSSLIVRDAEDIGDNDIDQVALQDSEVDPAVSVTKRKKPKPTSRTGGSKRRRAR